MKNTVTKGKFHFVILKWGNSYLGICKELGFVEEWDTAEEVKKHLLNGFVATIKAVEQNPNLEKSLNTNPPLKYLAIYYLAPLFFYAGKVVVRFSQDETSLIAYA